jgi:DNA polymerase I-like protein with 3'-5' exonuclease and polymerase domains
MLLTSDFPTSLPKIRVVDTETCDPHLKRRGPGWPYYDVAEAGIIGIGVFCPENNQKFYIPINHANSECVDIDTAMRWAEQVLFDPDCTMVFANAEYDLGWFHHHGVKYNGFKIEDVQVQAPLINEHEFSFSLENLSRRNKVAQKNEEVLLQYAQQVGIASKDVKASLRFMPADIVGQYCVDDCIATWENFQAQLPEMERQNLWSIYELETSLIPHMIPMRMRGVRIDQDRCEVVSKQFFDLEQAARSVIKDQTGIHVESPWASAELAKVLDHVGIPYPTTPKTGKPSIKKDYMEGLPEHPVIDAIIDFRRFNKARTTFTEGFFDEFCIKGRVHTNFNLLKSDEGGTISGRLSSDSPNMQQIPARDPEIGPLVRSIILAEEDCLFASLDYSQQEPRHTVHMAYLLRNASAAVLREQFILNPKTDFHQMNSDLTGIPRKAVKEIGLGLAYGMGGGKLARKLRLPFTLSNFRGKEIEKAGPEAQALLDKFHARAPYIKDLGKECKKAAQSRGYIRTPMGRVIHFPTINGEVWKSHKALNGLIQGMSADETKRAMVMCAQAGFPCALQVHDELNFTQFSNPEDTYVVAQIMLDAMITSVPSKVDVEIGKSWGECELYEFKTHTLKRSYVERDSQELLYAA